MYFIFNSYGRFKRCNKAYREQKKSLEVEKHLASKEKIDLTIKELVKNGILQSDVSVIKIVKINKTNE